MIKNLNLHDYDINGSKQIIDLIKKILKMTKIIAELCQNHNGDIKILQEMVHAAARSGAEYAKIQSMLSKDLTHRKDLIMDLLRVEK